MFATVFFDSYEHEKFRSLKFQRFSGSITLKSDVKSTFPALCKVKNAKCFFMVWPFTAQFTTPVLAAVHINGKCHAVTEIRERNFCFLVSRRAKEYKASLVNEDVGPE